MTADDGKTPVTLRQWSENIVATSGGVACRSSGATPVTLLRAGIAGIPPGVRLAEFVVALILDKPVSARMDFGYGQFDGRARPGSFLVLPPNQPICVESDARSVTLLEVAIPAERFGPPENSRRFDPERLHTRVHADHLVTQLVHRLWDEAATGNPWGDLFADHATDTLVALLHRLANPKKHSPRARGKLTAVQFAAVIEFVLNNLDRPIGLADLAAVARLSPFHFARHFKATTGQPPHQYVIGQRVERAKMLLAGRRLPLVEVAMAVGFTDQSQFTKHFKRLVGCTPTQFGGIPQE